MADKASKRAYYRIALELQAPLSIGSADSIETDSDVVLDGAGNPFIPATTIAGVCRSFFSPEDGDAFFGKRIREGSFDVSESVVRVYDGIWEQPSNNAISARDNVSLHEKVAVPGAKFDRQIVERGARFTTYLEVRDANLCPLGQIEDMLGAVHAGSLTFGSKGTRGFGRVRLAAIWKRVFNLDDEQDCLNWLDFKMFDAASWRKSDMLDPDGFAPTCNQEVLFRLSLEQQGALSIREYSTVPERPDFGQLYIRGQKDAEGADVPVIPGTSWAGAFRDRYRRFSSEEAVRKLFGFVEAAEGGGANVRKSRISFSESVVSGGAWKEITRNSIDRFTGGTKDGALFSMRTYYAGRTELEIRIALANDEWRAEDFIPLLAAMRDLHLGFMPVGGLTAVGHGVFRVHDATLDIHGKPCEGFCQKLFTPNDTEPDYRVIAQEIAGCISNDARTPGKEGENA